MHKFFVPKENVKDDLIFVNGEDVLHISKVLRLRNNDEVLISDGNGMEFVCLIGDISKKEVTLKIVKSFENSTEPPLNITLFQGIPKASKMDLIIQKCVEIGVYKIQPVITERVVVKFDAKDPSNKNDRWQRISEEASKQSNRGIVPEIGAPIQFSYAIEEMKKMDLAVVPYENERGNSLRKILTHKNGANSLGIFIGPEGGFEEGEIEICLKNNIIPVSLGPRILRTETAGFVAAAIALYELGDMGGNL